jgi:hypothetical protein
MGNTEVKVFLRMKSLESATWASDFFGQELRWLTQVGEVESESDAEQRISVSRYVNPRHTEGKTSSISQREMYDQKVRPEVLLHHLGVGEAVINWEREPLRVNLSWADPQIPVGWDYNALVPRFHRKEPIPLGLAERVNQRIFRQLENEMGNSSK